MSFAPDAFLAKGEGGDIEIHQEVEETEESTQEVSDDTQEVSDPILGDDEAEEDGDEDPFAQDDEGGEEAEEGTRNPGVEKRINKLVAEREIAKDRAAELEVEKAKLEGRTTALEEQLAIVSEFYEGADLNQMLKFDAAFMATFEKLAKNDPTIQAAAQKVQAELPEDLRMSSKRGAQSAEKSEAPKADPAIQAILAREAKRVITEALPKNVLPSFSSVFAAHLERSTTPNELAAMDTDDVLAAAKEFAKSNNFTKAEIYGSNAQSATRSKPPTGGKQVAAPASESDAAAAAERKEAEKPKSLSEWSRGQAARVEEFFRNNAS